MPDHYVYDDLDTTALWQGDVLDKAADLLSVVQTVHPTIHDDSKYFLVLTQSCDLVRREGQLCAAPYINLAAVHPVENAIRREAAKLQDTWQKEKSVVSSKDRDRIVLFLQRLIDNNEPGYFYLHKDISTEIHLECAAFLTLSIPLPIEHYDLCLKAKVAQIQQPFQAKLGWLIGNMYSRVGTDEWDTKYPTNPAVQEANQLFKRTLVAIPDDKLKEGLADLRREPGGLAGKTPDEIYEYITKKKILPRSKQFEARAIPVLRENVKPLNLIKGRLETALRADVELKESITEQLSELGVEDTEASAEQILNHLLQKIRLVLSDQQFPDAEAVMRKIVAGLLQDPQISKIMR